MSDKMRWRWGDENHVKAAVHADTVIEIGDILYQDTDRAHPASNIADQSNLVLNQEALALCFLGVAMQRSRVFATDPIRVATTGVFEFDCPSSIFALGNLIGVNEGPCGTELENQQVIEVTGELRAIGRVAKWEPTEATSVYVDIRSQVMGISL